MRLVAAAALVAALSSAPSAQTQFADSAGVYVSLHDIRLHGAEASVGYRTAGGFDYGVRYRRFTQDYGSTGVRLSSVEGELSSVRNFRVGPELGYTRRLSDRVVGRISASVLYSSGQTTFVDSPEPDVTRSRAFTSESLASNLTATVGRRVPVVGSFQIQPTAGLFVETHRTLRFDLPLSNRETFPQSDAAAGLHLELPISFRLLGQDVTLASYGQVPLVGRDFFSRTYAGGGLRVNF